MRSQTDYIPPINVEAEIDNLVTKHGSNFTSLETKFQLLAACVEAFNHSVPNSLLHQINTVEQLKEFYTTPIDSRTPYDRLQAMDDLPKNLHTQSDYVRWHPDTDTKFGGVTAFPKSSTLVTGLKTREKYKGHYQGNIWEDC